MDRRNWVAGVVVALVVLSGSALALPFQNGSFENPPVPAPPYYALGNSNFLTGWTSTTSGFPQPWTQNYLYDRSFDKVTSGNQAVLFNSDGIGGVTTTLFQTFDTLAGRPYFVTFDLGRENGGTGTYPPISLQASGNAPVTYTAVLERMVRQTYAFTAAGSSTTLTFAQTGGPGLSPELDNVVVKEVTGPVVVNHSFEADTFGTWPGYSSQGGNGPITGWTSSRPTNTGINPIGDGSAPFADNGAVPEGRQIAFLQSSGAPSTLSQVVSGFDPNGLYVVTYRENSRNGPQSNMEVQVGGATVMPLHNIPQVGGVNPYHYMRTHAFQPATAAMALSFTNSAAGDTTALLDMVEIRQVSANPATVLFQDTFSVTNNDNDLNYQIPGTRQSGSIVTPSGVTYTEAPRTMGGDRSWRTQMNNGDYPNAVLLAASASDGFSSVWISPDHDFVETPTAGRMVIQCDLDPVHQMSGQRPLTDWVGVVVGASSQGRPDLNSTQTFVNNSDGFGFLLRENGGWELYAGSTLVASELSNLDFAGGVHTVEFDLNTGSFAPGSSVSVQVLLDSVPLAQCQGLSSGHNWVTLEAYGSVGDHTLSAVDNLLIYDVSMVIPEPGTLSLLGLGALGLLSRRRRRSA